jgi:hypothetical protein
VATWRSVRAQPRGGRQPGGVRAPCQAKMRARRQGRALLLASNRGLPVFRLIGRFLCRNCVRFLPGAVDFGEVPPPVTCTFICRKTAGGGDLPTICRGFARQAYRRVSAENADASHTAPARIWQIGTR